MDTSVTEHNDTNQLAYPVKNEHVYYAGFWMRLWAYLLDLLVVGSLNRIFIYPAFRYFDIPLAEAGSLAPVAIVTALVMYSYFVIMTKLIGQTIGKMLFGLKVVAEKGTLTWLDVIFREFIGKFISKTLLFIGFVAIAFSKKKRGFHDYFGDTYVIHIER